MTVGIRRAQKFPINIYCCADRAFLEVAYAVVVGGNMETNTIAVAVTKSKPPDSVEEVSVLFQVGADPKKWHDLASTVVHEITHAAHKRATFLGTPFWFSEGMSQQYGNHQANMSVEKKRRVLENWRRLNAAISNSNFSIVKFMDGGADHQIAYLDQVSVLLNGQPIIANIQGVQKQLSFLDIWGLPTIPDNQGILRANPYYATDEIALHYAIGQSICSFFLSHPQSTRYFGSLIKQTHGNSANDKDTPAKKFTALLKNTWSPQGNGIADFEKGWRVWLAYLGASGDPDPTLDKAYWAINPALAQQYGLKPAVNWDAEIAAANVDLQDILNGNPPPPQRKSWPNKDNSTVF